MEGFGANFQTASELPNLTNLPINIPSKSAWDKHGWICAASVVRTSQVCVFRGTAEIQIYSDG